MHTTATSPPDGVPLLADHLDAALAAGEDLLAARLMPMADLDADEAPELALARFVGEIRRHEASVLLHLLQARRRAGEVRGVDPAVRSVLTLIGSSTEALVDLVAHYGERHTERFQTGDDLQQVLRSRGLIPPDAAGVGPFEAITVDEGFRIGGLVSLGSLLDMTAAALDVLDRQFDLFGADAGTTPAAEAQAPTKTATEPAVVAAAGEPQVVAAVVDAAAVPPEDGLSPGSLRSALEELARSN